MKQRDIFYQFPHWLQLVCLFLVFIGCVLVCSNVAAILAVLCFGADALSKTVPLLLVQAISVAGGFLLPALWFGNMQKAGNPDLLRLHQPVPLRLLGLALLAYLLLCPFVSAMQEWNAIWHFPERWLNVEEYLRVKSMKADELSKKMLLTNNWGVFVGSLLVVAFGAGICEEFFFRGCLQNLFRSWFRNTHAAVWTAAVIFSLFHGDFFGFLPRVLLGAFLGYLYIWSGTIWIPIIVHSFNNAVLVTAYFLHFNHYIAFNPEHLEQSPQWYIVVPCMAACIGLCLRMAGISKKKPS